MPFTLLGSRFSEHEQGSEKFRSVNEALSSMQLGLIGLGRMGGNMARRLIAGGHQVVVWDRSADRREGARRPWSDRTRRRSRISSDG